MRRTYADASDPDGSNADIKSDGGLDSGKDTRWAVSEKDSLYVCDETENDPGRRPLESFEAMWDLPRTLSGCFSARFVAGGRR